MKHPSSLLNFGESNKIRPIMQTETAECGLACITMILNYYNSDVDLSSLRRQYPVSQRGTTLKDLVSIANSLNLITRAVKCPLESLGDLPAPAILHWDMNHFVVLEAVSRNGKRFLIHDPAHGTRNLTLAEISRHYTGIALELRISSEFKPLKAHEKLKFTQLWNSIHGLKRSIAQIFMLTLVLQAYVIVSPYLLQVSVDTVLPSLDLDFLAVLVLGFGGFGIINVSATLLRGLILMRMGSSFSFQIGINLARRLLRLPIPYFERRHIGDILSRFLSIEPIQEVLSTGAIAAVVDSVLAVITFGLMLFYSPRLAMITGIVFLLYIGIRLGTYTLERRRGENLIIMEARQQSTVIETLRGITTLRIFGREDDRLVIWQNRMADTVNARMATARLGLWQENANMLLFSIENILVIYFSIRLAIDGGFTVGMVFAYMAYKQQFVEKASNAINELMKIRMLSLHLERMSDIALQDEDDCFAPRPSNGKEISGSLQLSNIVYRYSPTEPAVLNGISLNVASGNHIAITGPSGGGKSTLLKIMLALVDPEEGKVLLDGEPISVVGVRHYRKSIAAVLQDDQIFAGSIADNITFFDQQPDMEWAQECARMASVHPEIMAMPMRYETLVGDMGASLSGGQKQRILLARALYQRPKILFMDEGTSHLDSLNERTVNKAISALGITRIVIAHRAETIRNAEEVYWLEHGQLYRIDRDAAPQAPAFPTAPNLDVPAS